MALSKEFLQSLEGGQSSRDENLYGFIPGGWLPDWVKTGYNQSIEGMAQQVMSGNPVFNVSESYDPNMMEDIAATVVSFLTPTDVAALFLGGGIGTAAIKKMAVSKIVKAGGRKGLAKMAVEKAYPRVANQARVKAVTGGTGLGFYSGLQSSLGQKVTGDDVDLVKTLKDTATGAALGVATGGLGTLAKQGALAKGLTGRQATAIEKSAEVGLFGTMGPLMEGELPSAESYIHAAGVIGGLGLSRGIARKIIKPPPDILNASEQEQLFFKRAEGVAKERSKHQRKDETWTDGKREVVIETDWHNSQRNETVLKLRVKKDGELTDETFKMNKKEFFQDGNFHRKKDKFGNDVYRDIQKRIFGIRNDLKLKDLDFKNMIDRVLEKETPLKEHEGKGRDYHTGFEKVKSFEQRQRLLMELEGRQFVEKEIAEYAKNGIYVKEVSGKSFLQKHVPIIHDVIQGLRPKIARFTDPISRQLVKITQNMDFRQSDLSKRMFNLLNEAKYTLEDGTVLKGLKKLTKKQREQLSDDLENTDPAVQNRVRDYRRILSTVYSMAKKSGIKVAPFEKGYYPLKIKRKVLNILREDLESFLPKDDRGLGNDLINRQGFEQRLKQAIDGKELSDTTIEAMESIRDTMQKNQKRPISMSEAFQNLRNDVLSEFVIVNKNLEVSRKKFRLPNEFYERDAGKVLADYATSVAKRIAYVESAGVKGKEVFDRINALRKAGKHKEAELMSKAFNSYTGVIQLESKYNWNPRSKRFLNDIVNFQVATKIGLGLATIPNLTQTFISSALKAGYSPFFKGTFKMLTDKKYRNKIKKYSGATALELHQMGIQFQPSDVSFTGRVADNITKMSGFQGINKINMMVSAYTGFEGALRWQKIAKTSKFKARRDWAKRNLRDMGVTDVNKKLNPKNMSRAMYEFARDTQLQKNVLREPDFANDPRFQPFFLFKRFGYRQAEWIGKELKKEVIDSKNPMFALRLGVAGMAGGQFVNWARQAVTDFFAGEDVYDEKYKGVDGYGMNDFIDGMAAVGGFGIVSDIIASESKWRALEFAAKPVMIQDASKAYTTLQKIVNDMEDFGPSWVVGQRAMTNIAPVFGSIPRRLMEQAFRTKGQRTQYIRTRLGQIRPRILDYMISGDNRMAQRLIREWNNSFPERPLRYDDINASEINKRLMRKYKKSMNP